MKQKNKYTSAYHLLAFLLIFSIWSCKEDFLERLPQDSISSLSFFKTAEDLQLYANRFYPLLPANAGYSYTFLIDQNSDNLVPATFDPRLAGTRTIPSSG